MITENELAGIESEWLRKENRNRKNKKRNYVHFDPKITPPAILPYLKNPPKISQRAFYPFIKFTIATPRYKKNKKDGSRTIEIKERVICYASHLDTMIYSWYACLLGQEYEKVLKEENISDSIIAFRKLNKCNVHFAKETFNHIKRKGKCVAIAFDITGFFDNLNHSLLKAAWLKILKTEKLPEDHYVIFKSLTKFSTVDRDSLDKEFGTLQGIKRKRTRICTPQEFRSRVREKGLIFRNNSNKGIPQGSSISALLSNIYMLPFDMAICEYMNIIDGFYRRYCDDVLIICNPEYKDEVISKIIGLIEKDRKLEINEDKTEITYFNIDAIGNQKAVNEKGGFGFIQYLGFQYDGKNILIRPASLSRYYRKMKWNVRSSLKQADKKGNGLLYKKKIFRLYTHLGKRNFISYAKRAYEEIGEQSLKRQVSPHMKKIQLHIKKIRQDLGMQ